MPRGSPLTAEEKAKRLEKADANAFLKKAAKSAKSMKEASKFVPLTKDSCIKRKAGWRSEKRQRDELESPSKRLKCGGTTGTTEAADSLGFFAVKGPLARYLRATAAESRKGSQFVVDLTVDDDSDDDDDHALLKPFW